MQGGEPRQRRWRRQSPAPEAQGATGTQDQAPERRTLARGSAEGQPGVFTEHQHSPRVCKEPQRVSATLGDHTEPGTVPVSTGQTGNPQEEQVTGQTAQRVHRPPTIPDCPQPTTAGAQTSRAPKQKPKGQRCRNTAALQQRSLGHLQGAKMPSTQQGKIHHVWQQIKDHQSRNATWMKGNVSNRISPSLTEASRVQRRGH